MEEFCCNLNSSEIKIISGFITKEEEIDILQEYEEVFRKMISIVFLDEQERF